VSAPLDLRPLDRARREAEIEAEQGLLGCLLCDGSALRDAANVRPAHFSDAVHGQIFDAIVEIAARNQILSPLSVADRLRGEEGFAELGGIGLLADLIDKAPPLAMTRDLAEHVVEAWARRELTALASEAARGAIEGKPASDMLAALRTALERLENEAAPEPVSFVTAREAATAALAEIELEVATGRAKGAQTGLNCFDRRLGGLPPGWLITVGGRPSMGKTALMRSAAYGAARQNPRSLFAIFSIEMDRREISERALSETSAEDNDQITTESLNRSKVTPIDLMRLHDHVRSIPDNLVLDDRSDLSVDDIRRAVWALKRRGDLSAIFIDYLQLMRRPDGRGRNEASVIGDMTQALKRLAREAKICVVLLSQLSRQVEGRDDKRPQLADLRESGSIEQDSNAVIFPFREAYYLERAEPKETDKETHLEWEVKLSDVRRRMDVIVAKCRQGSVGVERQLYDPEYDRIQNWWDR
jgi:replicative DNA helicase